MARIRLSEDAREDLVRLHAFLMERDPDVARNAAKTIITSLDGLDTFPERFRSAKASGKAGETIAESGDECTGYREPASESASESASEEDVEFRLLPIPFGRYGYSAAYVYEAGSDEVIVLGIKHQLEEFFPFELESGEEADSGPDCEE